MSKLSDDIEAICCQAWIHLRYDFCSRARAIIDFVGSNYVSSHNCDWNTFLLLSAKYSYGCAHGWELASIRNGDSCFVFSLVFADFWFLCRLCAPTWSFSPLFLVFRFRTLVPYFDLNVRFWLSSWTLALPWKSPANPATGRFYRRRIYNPEDVASVIPSNNKNL